MFWGVFLIDTFHISNKFHELPFLSRVSWFLTPLPGLARTLTMIYWTKSGCGFTTARQPGWSPNSPRWMLKTWHCGGKGGRRIAQKSMYSISLLQNLGCISGISLVSFTNLVSIAGNFLLCVRPFSSHVFLFLGTIPRFFTDPTRHTMRSTLFLRSPCLVVGHQWYDQCCQKWVACWKSSGWCKPPNNSHGNGKPTIWIRISYSQYFKIVIFQCYVSFPVCVCAFFLFVSGVLT